MPLDRLTPFCIVPMEEYGLGNLLSVAFLANVCARPSPFPAAPALASSSRLPRQFRTCTEVKARSEFEVFRALTVGEDSGEMSLREGGE